MDSDSLQEVLTTATNVLKEKEPSLIDTLEKLGTIKDSLLVTAGNIKTLLRVTTNNTDRNKLKLTLDKVQDLISVCRESIMSGTIEILRPTNEMLKRLIKDMKERTEQLRSIATTIAAVSDVITTLTNILASPVFAPVSSPPAVPGT